MKFRKEVQKNTEIFHFGLTEFSTTTISYPLANAATAISAKRVVLQQ